MFAKSKRFQEGAKDYIPGPGEYDVPTEEMNRRGRFGYNGAGRFSESLLSVDSTFSDYTYVGENSPSSLSTVSSGSKNDDRSRHGSNISYQFEKYRQAMQKEIDSLQTRGRKLEASLQTVATEKTELQASVLEKELELADVRQKNNALQKTVSVFTLPITQ
ncbi:hypothetical protein CLU79DRAFT_338427 [Phycomyces nitens]|nr:hypothetical protein CLU79DRAFT_338427 [Phycomyces nitens]